MMASRLECFSFQWVFASGVGNSGIEVSSGEAEQLLLLLLAGVVDMFIIEALFDFGSGDA